MDEDAVLAFTEKLDGLISVITSYKAKLITAGFDRAIAEQMCVSFNAHLLALAMTPRRRSR